MDCMHWKISRGNRLILVVSRESHSEHEHMSDAFIQVWDESRSNAWTWAYPMFLKSAVILLILFSLIRRPWLRRAIKLIATIAFTIGATFLAGLDIEEKWRIRHAWADANLDKMTDLDWQALTADTNYTLGPLFRGGQAAGYFLLLLLIIFSIRQGFLLYREERVKSVRAANDISAHSYSSAAGAATD